MLCAQEIIHLQLVGDVMIKLFVDDLRNPPDNTWKVVRNYGDAVAFMNSLSEAPDIVSLDHDLGNVPQDGYDVFCYIEQRVIGIMDWKKCPEVIAHSMNPVGRRRIEAGYKAMREMWERMN